MVNFIKKMMKFHRIQQIKIIEEIVISKNEIIIKNKLRNYEYILVNLEELN